MLCYLFFFTFIIFDKNVEIMQNNGVSATKSFSFYVISVYQVIVSNGIFWFSFCKLRGNKNQIFFKVKQCVPKNNSKNTKNVEPRYQNQKETPTRKLS